jgi:hypothetical protein
MCGSNRSGNYLLVTTPTAPRGDCKSYLSLYPRTGFASACGWALAFGRCAAPIAVWVGTTLQPNPARHKNKIASSKEVAPFLVTFFRRSGKK